MIITKTTKTAADWHDTNTLKTDKKTGYSLRTNNLSQKTSYFFNQQIVFCCKRASSVFSSKTIIRLFFLPLHRKYKAIKAQNDWVYQNELDVISFIEEIKQKGLGVHYSQGENTTLIGLLGDTSKLDIQDFLAKEIVASAERVSAPYKMASRSFHPENSVIEVEIYG